MALTTVVDKAIGDVFSEAMWDDYIKTNINELIGRSSRNLLTNGGFEIWQRGAGSFTADLAYTADRWQIDLFSASTITVTQETSIVDDNSRSSLKAVYVQSANSLIKQKVEDGYQHRGKTLAVSFRVRPTTTQTIGVRLGDDTGTATTTTSCPANTWTTITQTQAISASATYVEVGISLQASMTVYIDNAMLVVGPNATEYVPLHPQEDLSRCQRYYEILSADYNSVASAGAQNLGYALNYRQDKPGTPTTTKNGTWSVTNCGQPDVAQRTGQETRMITIFAASSAAGVMQFTANGGDDTITSESNP